MNKKGFLLMEETLKIIIAVIVLTFLIAFLVSLYFSNEKNNDFLEAEANLEYLKNVLNSEMQEIEISLNNPEGWYLFSFMSGSSSIPNVCAGKNCLCICDNVLFDINIGFVDNSQSSECNKEGVCLVVENMDSFEPIEIEQVTNLIIKKNGGVTISKK